MWLRGVLGEIGGPEDEPTPFFIDSQSAEDLALIRYSTNGASISR